MSDGKLLLGNVCVKPSWANRYMGLCEHVATWSRDPSTKVGACIVDGGNKVSSIGFNGFPVGVADHPDRYDDRPTKYRLVVHAEANAILSARGKIDDASVLYTTLSPCEECAKLVIQSGIKTVVYSSARPNPYTDLMFKEAGVTMIDIKDIK